MKHGSERLRAVPGLRCPKCGGQHVIRKGNKEGVQRYGCGRQGEKSDLGCGWHGTHPVGLDGYREGIDTAAVSNLYRKVRSAGGVRRYVITAAQNATGVYQPFLDTLLAYCRHNGAQLLVIPYRYKNPTSIWSQDAQDDDWWAPELAPYLIDRRVALNDNLLLLADIKTQPTAANPLEGFETISGAMSAVIGHPKLELATIPTPHKKLPKLLTTTGAVTKPNYLPSKAGKRGEFHHTFAATVVELDGKLFFMRQLNAMRDGGFCDLDTEYRGSERRRIRAAGLVMGDTHRRFIDPGVVQATFTGKGSMIEVLRPRHLIWHDFNDGHAGSHHHRGDYLVNYVKHHNGKANVERELDESFAFVDAVTRPWAKNVFVYSNHPNEHLERWVRETDPRGDPENCVFWARSFEAVCTGSRWTPAGAKSINLLSYWAERKLKCYPHSIFLEPDQSFALAGVELGFHGHQGPNGARGTIRNYGKIGVRTIIGHSHTPGIKDGVMQVGTSSLLRLEYNHGPSSWLHAHGVLYPNGKRSLLIIVDGRWRA